ncbi:hypothetical protein [Ferribacterium limneticum]|uniref:hypothetical protein n=1 Tax=Ferribacterium limneticum TaxID=76259 RepID=UPI001CFC2E8C|nr:hypothetical protein [Ferribacterium limneticum]UCV19807.1 hypothetical protein KI610_04320 [Ferribacterium limneticum]
MTLRAKLLASFHALATGTLRLDPASADAFSNHVANACEGLHVIGQLCTAPNALQSATLAIMLERWFRLLPEFEAARQILERKAGPSQVAPNLDAASALLLHSRILEVSLSQRALPETRAMRVADLVRDAASAFFALEQKCRAPDRHTQKLLAATLRAALGQPLSQAREAACIFLNSDRK